MPRLTDSIPINNKALDRRVKLSDDDKELIRWLREEEQISYQKLADKFGVSKRLVQFICNPEKLVANKQKRLDRGGWKQYYDKDDHATATKEHREYKKELNKKGLLVSSTPAVDLEVKKDGL